MHSKTIAHLKSDTLLADISRLGCLLRRFSDVAKRANVLLFETDFVVFEGDFLGGDAELECRTHVVGVRVIVYISEKPSKILIHVVSLLSSTMFMSNHKRFNELTTFKTLTHTITQKTNCTYFLKRNRAPLANYFSVYACNVTCTV